MSFIRRVGFAAWLLLAVSASAVAGQGSGAAATEAYFGAVAEYFMLPRSEVAILGEWRLPADEIPVVLYVARRAGVSPEAVVALRSSGLAWAELGRRYRMDAAQYHVPIPETAAAGPLQGAYERFRAVSPGRWRDIALSDSDVVGLVNLRMFSETLKRPPQEILAEPEQGSWVALYARLVGGASPVG